MKKKGKVLLHVVDKMEFKDQYHTERGQLQLYGDNARRRLQQTYGDISGKVKRINSDHTGREASKRR